MFFTKKSKHPETEEQEKSSEESALQALKDRIDTAKLPPRAMAAATKEFEKLSRTDPAMAEYSVGLNYIDLINSLPWNTSSRGALELKRAEAILNSRHYGLAQINERILELLAAKTLRNAIPPRILIVDDEIIACTNLQYTLEKEGYSCICAANGRKAMDIITSTDIDVILSDLKMDQMDGLQLLEEIKLLDLDIPMILITGFASVDSAVQALKKGAAHYLGKPLNLKELKKTVREVLQSKQTMDMGKGPILCFTGPPGTGKTSIGKDIAEALHLHFIRISLAGLRDEANLRGHRRTYIGAMPGKILSEIQRVGVNNPVFLIDEIDKIGQDFRGDPASVLLEVLDPEQNSRFMDHYLDIPFNLSQVMFIATANDLSTLPSPLLDRMEVIEFRGYTKSEKTHIASQFLIPRQLKEAGLHQEQITFSPQAIGKIITDYTKETGLRNLEREIASICRKLALKRLRARETEAAFPTIQIDEAAIHGFLGPKKFLTDSSADPPLPGITTGLVWSGTGGEALKVETARMSGTGQLLLTGSVGNVLQESAQTALSLIRSKAHTFNIDETLFHTLDIHIHFPAGAISKDGASAGITIFMALLSRLTGQPAHQDIAMTGEITLSGRILGVNGIREKLLAANRTGIRRIILPAANEEDVLALSPDILESLQIFQVSFIDEIIDQVLIPLSS